MKPIRFLLAFFMLSATSVFAQDAPRIEIFKSASCGCCGAWVDHRHENGFEVVTHDVTEIPAQRKKLGMPGSPGMEGPYAVPYSTLLASRDRSGRIFASH